MPLLGIVFADGCCKVVLPHGQAAAITLGGAPVAAFQDGWCPLHVYSGLAPFYLLELRHEDGREAHWWLDEGMRHAATLHPAEAHALAVRISALFERLWTELFRDPVPAPSAEVADFLSLGRTLRLEVFGIWQAGTVEPTAPIIPAQAGIQAVGPRLNEVGAKFDRIELVLSLVIQAALPGFIAQGYVGLPSVFTAHEVRTTHSLCLDTFRILYRCVDGVYGRVFYVGVTGHHCTVACVLIPDAGGDLLLCRDEAGRVQTAGILLPSPRKDLIGHACATGPDLLAYLGGTPAFFANVQRAEARHMAHMLWNELTGLMHLVDELPADRLPLCIVPNPGGDAELYGPIDAVFPELRGRVTRTLPDTDAFVAYAYRNGICIVRTTGLVVTQALRDRIAAHLGTLADLDPDRAQLAALRAAGVPVVTVGLRVENRTAVDVAEFCTEVIEALHAHLGPLAVVLDGHNALGPDTYMSSNQEWRAGRRPVDVERGVVEQVRRAFAGRPVTVLDMVGQSMQRGLFWIGASRCFVAPWGTGMAKYRWVCNLPGYVVTQDWNVRLRGDVGIYGEPCNAGAAPLAWAPAAVVTPDPAAPLLVEVSDWPRESFENFRIDYPAMLPLMLAALAPALEPPGPPPAPTPPAAPAG